MSRKRGLDQTDQIVARNIRFHRIERDLSQEAVADKLGVTFQQLQKYEKGINRVTIGRLVQIAKALDLPLSVLLDGVEEPKSIRQSVTLRKRLSDPLAVRLLDAFSSVTQPAVRRAVVTLLEQFVSIVGRGPATGRAIGEEQR